MKMSALKFLPVFPPEHRVRSNTAIRPVVVLYYFVASQNICGILHRSPEAETEQDVQWFCTTKKIINK